MSSANIYDQIGGTSKRHYQKLNRLIEPLARFCGVDRFWRNAHGLDGSYSVIGNFPPTAEKFFGEGLYIGHPYFRHPKFFCSGYTIPSLFQSRDFEKTQGKLSKGGDCYHVLVVIRKHAKGFIEYGFATSKERPGFEMYYLNYLSTISKFIDYVEREAAAIINEARELHSINILDFTGKSYHQKPDCTNSTCLPEDELTFLSVLENSPEKAEALRSLTKTELFVLSHYMQGHTAKEIAQELYRSPRTIETHLENAKGKLGAENRSQLFDLLLPYQEVIGKLVSH